MYAIVCTDKNGAIGFNGKRLFEIEEIINFFNKKTENHTIIMGRRTFESLSVNRDRLHNSGFELIGLSKRHNIVLSRDKNYSNKTKNVLVLHNIPDLLYLLNLNDNKYNHHYMKKFNMESKTYVIGGDKIFRLLEPYITKYYVIRVNYEVNNADAFFYVPHYMKIKKIRKLENKSYPGTVIEEWI